MISDTAERSSHDYGAQMCFTYVTLARCEKICCSESTYASMSFAKARVHMGV